MRAEDTALATEPLDEDGYPTDYALNKIEQWDHREGWHGLMDYIGSIWHLADWGWHWENKMDESHDKPVVAYNISTAGWSGNESIIAAMKANVLFWMCCWVQSRRGGHYIFYLDPKQP